jgi:hypothetical protein
MGHVKPFGEGQEDGEVRLPRAENRGIETLFQTCSWRIAQCLSDFVQSLSPFSAKGGGDVGTEGTQRGRGCRSRDQSLLRHGPVGCRRNSCWTRSRHVRVNRSRAPSLNTCARHAIVIACCRSPETSAAVLPSPTATV